MAGLELTPQLFAIFSKLVEDACGVHYGPADRELLGTKLRAIAADAGFDTLLDYYYRLRYDDPDGSALSALVQGIVVHETYFFRELPALVQLVEHLLVPRIRATGRVRVWSAACSTGEEPYTLAMLLAERGLLAQTELVATDISAAAIARARAGNHGRRALRGTYPLELADRYLELGTAGPRVVSALRDAVQFQVLSLLDGTGVAALGAFDAILCRNVLIYFNDATVTEVVERLRRALAPGGWLAIGVSESLMRFGTAMRCEEHGGSFFYRSAQ